MAFKKGEVSNPAGGKKLKPEEKFHRAMTRVEFQQLAFKMLFSNRDQFKKQLESPDATMLELAVGSVIKKGVQEGSEKHLNFLLEQTIGKVRENIHIEVEGKLTAEKLRPEDIRKILAADPFFAAKTIEVESGSVNGRANKKQPAQRKRSSGEGSGEPPSPVRQSTDGYIESVQIIGGTQGEDRASGEGLPGSDRSDHGTPSREPSPALGAPSTVEEDRGTGDDSFENPDGERHLSGDDEDLGESW